MTLLSPEMLRGRFMLGDHQHVEDDHRRQAQDHRPDAERPENVFGGKALLFREWIILSTHNAPAFLVLWVLDTREILKSRFAISLAFDHKCYRGLTTAAAVSFRSRGARPRPAPSRAASPTGRMTTPAADPARLRRAPQPDCRHREWFEWSLFPPSVCCWGNSIRLKF